MSGDQDSNRDNEISIEDDSVTQGNTRLSVCIACYNQARFLDDAIESIKIQDFEGVEIILVDDGSTDETPIMNGRPDLIYIRQDNGGLSSARNRGLKQAKGEYVTFLDADDIYFPGAFRAAIETIEKHPECGLVYAGYKIVDENLRPLIEINSESYSDQYAGLLERNHVAMHATVFYRRSIIVEAGGFDTGLAACEDYDMLLRIARIAPICSYDFLAAGYRMHGSNMTKDSALMLQSALEVMRRHENHAAERPDWKKSHARGIRFWKDFYGQKLAVDALHALAKGALPSSRSLWRGFRCDWRLPGRFVTHLLKRSWAKIRSTTRGA